MEPKDGMDKSITVRISSMYLRGLEKLVRKGVYSSKGEVIRDGLRMIFKKYNLDLLDL